MYTHADRSVAGMIEPHDSIWHIATVSGAAQVRPLSEVDLP
jgi:hypothetical protein